MSKIKRELQEDGVADVLKWFTFLASDVTGELAFGQTFNHVRDGKKHQFIHDIEQLVPVDGFITNLSWLRLFAMAIPSWVPRSPRGMFKRMAEWGQQAVHATRAAQQGDGRKTLFSKMIQDDEKQQIMPDHIVAFDAINIVVAGTDSTAMTLTYLVWAVLRNPDVHRKLVQELKSLSPNPRRQELEEFSYLNYVIEETLRLYPAAPASIPRVVPDGEEQVGKYVIPEGTTVATQSWTFQRDGSVFEDPLKYVHRSKPFPSTLIQSTNHESKIVQCNMN